MVLSVIIFQAVPRPAQKRLALQDPQRRFEMTRNMLIKCLKNTNSFKCFKSSSRSIIDQTDYFVTCLRFIKQIQNGPWLICMAVGSGATRGKRWVPCAERSKWRGKRNGPKSEKGIYLHTIWKYVVLYYYSCYLYTPYMYIYYYIVTLCFVAGLPYGSRRKPTSNRPAHRAGGPSSPENAEKLAALV